MKPALPVLLVVLTLAILARPANASETSPSPLTMQTSTPAAFDPRKFYPDSHFTVELQHTFISTTAPGWIGGSGAWNRINAQVEFNVKTVGRFSNTLSVRRLNSTYRYAVGADTYGTYWDETDCEDEFDYEINPHSPNPLWGVGVGWLHYHPVDDDGDRYHLRGIGVGIDKWPDFQRRVSIYGSAWYFPNMVPNSAYHSRYNIWQYDLGVNVRKNLESPWSAKIGYTSEPWVDKRGGGNLNFFGPYLRLTYWK